MTNKEIITKKLINENQHLIPEQCIGCTESKYYILSNKNISKEYKRGISLSYYCMNCSNYRPINRYNKQ